MCTYYIAALGQSVISFTVRQPWPTCNLSQVDGAFSPASLHAFSTGEWNSSSAFPGHLAAWLLWRVTTSCSLGGCTQLVEGTKGSWVSELSLSSSQQAIRLWTGPVESAWSLSWTVSGTQASPCPQGARESFPWQGSTAGAWPAWAHRVSTLLPGGRKLLSCLCCSFPGNSLTCPFSPLGQSSSILFRT